MAIMKQSKLPKRKFNQNFKDGVQSLSSAVLNNRNALNNNAIFNPKLPIPQMTEMYKGGVGNKIINLKSGHAMRDSLQFDTERDREYYEQYFAEKVLEAVTWMLVYGRAIIAIVEINGDMETPLSKDFQEGSYKLEVFSGEVVTGYGASVDIMSEFYQKPKFYSVYGYQFHHTRVIDFKYVKPPQREVPLYDYGGMSEFQLVYNQLISDGVVERAGTSIVEKNSTLFYKVKDLKDLMISGQEKEVIDYMGAAERSRSMYGATIMDFEDEAFVLNQTLTDLDKVDNITLRRLAMVTNIPLPWLVGENAQGMNSAGEQETAIFWWMIGGLRQNHILPAIQKLYRKFSIRAPKFKKQNDLTPDQLIKYESIAIDSAFKLHEITGGGDAYLKEKGIIKDDPMSQIFKDPDDDDNEDDVNFDELDNDDKKTIGNKDNSMIFSLPYGQEAQEGSN
jgi:hypothetical protein